jgi:hypothetical protein
MELNPNDMRNPSPSADRRLMTCPPFDPARLKRELWIDQAARWSTVILVLLAILVFQTGLSSMDFWLLMIPVVILWVAISAPSAKVMPLLPQISQWLDQDLPAAEDAIAQSLARRPLHRQLRIQLYHRLAILRHYQNRIDESAVIAQTLLAMPLGASEIHRPQLLLILVESRLLRNDLAGAYWGLNELSHLKLSLLESLQHLALRTRYEVASGYNAMALADLPRKIHYAQMLPAPQCGALHLLLAAAARQVNDQPLHDWLMRRAQLLCEPRVFDEYQQGRLAFGVEKSLTLAPL